MGLPHGFFPEFLWRYSCLFPEEFGKIRIVTKI